MGSPIPVRHEGGSEQVAAPHLLASVNVPPAQFGRRTDEGLGKQLHAMLVQTRSFASNVLKPPVCP
jgi:hypothetical protein